jgi:hypothetical protein
MRRYERIVRHCLAAALTVAATMVVATGGAGATVIDTSAIGASSVSYNPNGQESYVGVDMVPVQRSPSAMTAAKVGTVISSAPCLDPALTSDLGGPFLPSQGLCSHGGPVLHKNETFVVTWDPLRRYFATTRNYVQQFLRDVADGSGTFTSPYGVTSQYTDSTDRAAFASLYGGGCIDFGVTGGSACQFGSTNASGPGHNYPATNSCTPTGTDMRWGPDLVQHANDVCMINVDLKNEVKQMISQTGMLGHVKPGYSPLVTLLTPPGVVTCIDGGATPRLCSANSNTHYVDGLGSTPCADAGYLSPCSLPNVPARFCSYHGQVQMDDGSQVQFLVQPWTAETTSQGGCDEFEPDVDPIPTPVDVQLLAKYIGERLVSPLSQAQMEAITDPAMNGWFALNGSEIGDWNSAFYNSACIPLPKALDKVTVGPSAQNPYILQREFNNAGLIETDPNALACTGWVNLQSRFVVPSAVNQGDVVEFDGSTTISTMMVPKASYFWDFGDGHTSVGPSVVHAFTKAGTYAVKLTTVDRGGNVSTLSQGITVLDSNGQPVSGNGNGGNGGGTTVLQVRLQLLPQGLRTMLRSGLAMKVTSNEAANGIVTVAISRSSAKRAHIRVGRGPSVVIGRGTVSKIKAGTVSLRLHLARATVAKLRHLRHVTLTIRVALVDANGVHRAFVAAGRY